jgi:antitoxin component of MazEF toxin-antitoxin module|tara:strand:- start:291 stop:515 length:225 start_codon:yes stop_codon:yes gene_type:complete
MIKKLTKHGNSYALIIDKPILKLLHFKFDSELVLTIVDDSLVIRKAEKSRQERINDALEKIDEQYGDVLKKLSE